MDKEQSFKAYMKNDARLDRECACEDLDFWWDRPELMQMKKMWKKGTSISEMAEHFDRDPDEVFMGLFHLSRQGKIDYRLERVYGWT